MCGILGHYGRQGSVSTNQWELAQNIQRHRGPDGDSDIRIGLFDRELLLAHQRLAIIDLSDAGEQPMGSIDGDGVLVFNGELYNYLELRNELIKEGRKFISQTDSEVVLQAMSAWGPERAVRRFNGMWAIAWLEPGGKRLWFSRDRAGEKPLYWHSDKDGFYFASEVKTILALTGKRFKLDLQSVGEYVVQSLGDTGLRSYFSGISLLPAASLARLELAESEPKPVISQYWEPQLGVCQGSEEAQINLLREEFLDSVRLRLRSDVPVGVLLSGGLDSSAIAAAAHMVGGDGLTLLCAVSSDPRFDESRYAKMVASHLGMGLTEVHLDLSATEAMESLRHVTGFNDAPVGGFSNVAHYMLMQQAKDHGVTVILSGQGADELLCGYRKYLGFYIQQLLRDKHPLQAMSVLWRFWSSGVVLRQFSFAESKRYLPGRISDRKDICGDALCSYRPVPLGLSAEGGISKRQLLDLQYYSIPTLTHFEDRISMAMSREIRLPFLDQRIIERLLSLQVEYKLAYGWTKYIMRRVVEPWLPPEIVWRRDKQGFVNPESEWLKHKLADKVLEHFAQDSLIFRYGLICRKSLLSKYHSYRSQKPGRGDIWFREIFNPLALEIWLRLNQDYIEAP